MRRFIATLLSTVILSTGLLFSFVTPALAFDCGKATFIAWDDPNYTNTIGEATLYRCYNDYSSYTGNIPYLNANGVQIDECSSLFINHNNWNDCASSWKFTGSCHYGISVYTDANYSNLLWAAWGSRNMPGGNGMEDNMSSFRFNYRPTCPSSPAP